MPEPTQPEQQPAPSAAPEQPEPGTGPRIVSTPAQDPQADATGGGGEPEGGEDRGGTPNEAKLRREAAGYRAKLREAEEERDGLRERVATFQRAEVQTLVGDRLAYPDDLFLLAEVADFVGDDGQVDAEKVNEQIDAVLKRRPGWAKQPAPIFDGGFRGVVPNQRPSFGEALKDKAARR